MKGKIVTAESVLTGMKNLGYSENKSFLNEDTKSLMKDIAHKLGSKFSFDVKDQGMNGESTISTEIRKDSVSLLIYCQNNKIKFNIIGTEYKNKDLDITFEDSIDIGSLPKSCLNADVLTPMVLSVYNDILKKNYK
jgi:hypothetical protein